jgi:RNA polymerase sigma-70 factor (ECF subfamily)
MVLDEQLLWQLHNDPRAGLQTLMDEYLGLVSVIVKNRISSVCTIDDVEECVSDVFFAFYQRRKDIDLQKGSIKAYLCSIAKRKAIDLYRSKVIEMSKVSLDDEYTQESTTNGFTVEESFITNETSNILMKAICDLGEPDHEIIVRKFYFRERSKDISRRLNMTVTAIDSRTSRALVKLRHSLGGIFNG